MYPRDNFPAICVVVNELRSYGPIFDIFILQKAGDMNT